MAPSNAKAILTPTLTASMDPAWTADALGTLRIDYIAQKGPFAAHKVTCVIPESCEVVVAPTEGNNYQQVIEILLGLCLTSRNVR